MFKIEKYLSEIQLSIDNFYTDFDQEEYLHGTNFAYARSITEHKNLLIALLVCNNILEAEKQRDEFVYFCVTHEIPYMFVHGELLTISRDLMKHLAQEEDLESIKQISAYFEKLEMQITIAYFHKFLRRLATKNHLRLSHISNLVEKNLMVHYQHHIEWIIQLIDYVEHFGEDRPVPELNPMYCTFGKWLSSVTIPYIIPTSPFKEVEILHRSLHDLASDVVKQIQNIFQNLKNLLHLIQKIDYTSLQIGNEIAILNDMIMIEEYSKDPLTGLLTRRLFDKILLSQIDIAKATETQCAMIMCDLDNFKTINDTHGHLAGDKIIQNFSEVLQTLLRKSDFIFRFGGEEFIVLLPSTSEQYARKISQKICDHVADHKVLFDDISIRYTVSIGVISIHPEGTSCVLKDTIDRYVSQVDSKLYLAKQNGRNRIE
ncbi:MAG: diguanylate cyclase [Sulfuricurvum sp.]